MGAFRFEKELETERQTNGWNTSWRVGGGVEQGGWLEGTAKLRTP